LDDNLQYTGSDGDKTAIDNIFIRNRYLTPPHRHRSDSPFLAGTDSLVGVLAGTTRSTLDRQKARQFGSALRHQDCYFGATTRETATRIRYFLVLLGNFSPDPTQQNTRAGVNVFLRVQHTVPAIRLFLSVAL
jgi:hypothetical protein